MVWDGAWNDRFLTAIYKGKGIPVCEGMGGSSMNKSKYLQNSNNPIWLNCTVQLGTKEDELAKGTWYYIAKGPTCVLSSMWLLNLVGKGALMKDI